MDFSIRLLEKKASGIHLACSFWITVRMGGFVNDNGSFFFFLRSKTTGMRTAFRLCQWIPFRFHPCFRRQQPGETRQDCSNKANYPPKTYEESRCFGRASTEFCTAKSLLSNSKDKVCRNDFPQFLRPKEYGS